MSFRMRKFTFNFISRVSDRTKKITVKKLMSDADVESLTGTDIKNIFWDHAIENEINVKNYMMTGYTVSLHE